MHFPGRFIFKLSHHRSTHKYFCQDLFQTESPVVYHNLHYRSVFFCLQSPKTSFYSSICLTLCQAPSFFLSFGGFILSFIQVAHISPRFLFLGKKAVRKGSCYISILFYLPLSLLDDLLFPSRWEYRRSDSEQWGLRAIAHSHKEFHEFQSSKQEFPQSDLSSPILFPKSENPSRTSFSEYSFG